MRKMFVINVNYTIIYKYLIGLQIFLCSSYKKYFFFFAYFSRRMIIIVTASTCVIFFKLRQFILEAAEKTKELNGILLKFFNNFFRQTRCEARVQVSSIY